MNVEWQAERQDIFNRQSPYLGPSNNGSPGIPPFNSPGIDQMNSQQDLVGLGFLHQEATNQYDGLMGTIDPMLLSPNSETMGGYFPPPGNDQTATPPMSSNPYLLYDKMNRALNLNNDPPYAPGMVQQQAAVPRPGQNVPRGHRRRNPSASTWNHSENPSIFSRDGGTSTPNTGFDSITHAQPGNLIAALEAGGSGQPQWPSLGVQQSPKYDSYAAALTGKRQGQIQGGGHANYSRKSSYGHHLTPGPPEYQSIVPPTQQTAPSVLSMTPSSLPEVLLCEQGGCPATFKGIYRRGNQRRHMRLKHGIDMPYQCDLCHKTFKRSDARLKHKRIKHPGSAPAPVPRG